MMPGESLFVVGACALATAFSQKGNEMGIKRFNRSRPPSEMTVRAEALLSRYPRLGDHELAILIDLFPRLRILDVGLMTADDRLSRQVQAFHRDHGRKLASPISTLLGFLSLPAMLMLGLVWWYFGPAIQL
jgi:hypothetical protein